MFEGPDFRGEVLQGGGDWLVLRPVGSLPARRPGTLRTHDEALAYMTHFGVRHGPEDVMRRDGTPEEQAGTLKEKA